MKKILLILAVFALAAPAMAGVSVGVIDNNDGTGTLNYSMAGESSRVRAWALKVQVVSGGAKIIAVTPTHAGENDAVNKNFGIFPGTIHIVGGVISDPNTPVAPNDHPGAANTGLNTDTVILEMGSLFVDGNFPPNDANLATIQVDKTCTVTITAEVAYRGGIVRENSSLVTGPTLAANAPITLPVTDCLIGGVAHGGVPGSEYAKWVEYGKPDCWCYAKQCRGDADGLVELMKPVMLADLTAFKAVFGQFKSVVKTTVTAGEPGICADFDHKDELMKPVMLGDLTIFKEYFGDFPGTVPECDQAPVITGPWNEWKTP